jgi:hypothetical protein
MFKLGQIVYDSNNKRYGVVIGIYDQEPTEVRLDSDGMQPVEDLFPLGSKKDFGTKKKLIEALQSYDRLRKMYPYNNYPDLIFYELDLVGN